MALLEVGGGASGTCYALAEWMGKAGESSLSVAVSNGIQTYTGQMTNRDMRAWVRTTSLEHADYTKHLAQAFSGHNHFYDYVLHDAKELRVKFQAADGIKVLLTKIPLEDITGTPESYQVLASFVAQHVKARRKVKDLRSDIERLQRETTEMRQRAKKVSGQLEKRTNETKLQLISAINKKKTETYNLRHPDSPRKRWIPQLRRHGSWTRSQERLLNDEVNGSGSSMGGSFNTGESAGAFEAETFDSDRRHAHAHHPSSTARTRRSSYHNHNGDDNDDDDDDDDEAVADREEATARMAGGHRHRRHRRHGAEPHGKRAKEGHAGALRYEQAQSHSGEGTDKGVAGRDKPQLSKHNTLLELASRKASTSGTQRRRRRRRATSSSTRAQDKNKDEDADALLLDL